MASLLSRNAISPWIEMGAYEALWAEFGTWFKSLAQKFRAHPGALPSDFVPEERANEFSHRALELLKRGGVERFGIRINGAGGYPSRLREAEYPVEVLYYQGCWDLAETRSIAVVGTRKPSDGGRARAVTLTRALARDGFTIISGLATGIDTVVHTTALRSGAPTIAVIGTPLSEHYPLDNAELQRLIARDHLLISQVPVCRYANQTYHLNRRFFPERNITMSALSEATVIVEASDTSGTLTQARAALKQKRKLFILESCFHVPGLKWPWLYQQRGAIRVKDYGEIQQHLGQVPRYSQQADTA